MSVFTYKALGRDGRETTGTLTAEHRTAAITQVMEKGLHPLTVEEKAGAKAAAPKMQEGRVPQRSIEAFTRELANLLSGGVSLARAMQLLRRETSNPAARFLWTKIHDDVIGGTSLGDAMAKWPQAFSSVYVAMVRAGEAGGFLDLVLNQIAEFRSREQDLRGKVKAAMVYPIVLGVLAIAVLIFLMTYFIPTFSTMFKEFGGSLPALTQFIIAASHVVTSYGLFVAAAVALGVYLLKRALSTESGRRSIERGMLNAPILGNVVAHFALVRFCRMLGTLLNSGVPLVASLKVAKEALGNQTLSDTVSHAIDEVSRGVALSKALADSKKLFPSSVIEVIAVAEETGRLDKELIRLSTSFESELDRQLRMLVALAEPLLLIMMAGLIGTVVVGMLLPVFNLQDLVK